MAEHAAVVRVSWEVHARTEDGRNLPTGVHSGAIAVEIRGSDASELHRRAGELAESVAAAGSRINLPGPTPPPGMTIGGFGK